MKAAIPLMGAPHPSRATAHRRKAISEMLAIIILLALTVVAGVLVYQIFTGKAGVASTNTTVSIQSAYISGENGVMTLTIQNTGSNIINSLTVTVYQGGSTVSISPGGSQSVSITPGSSWSGTFTGSFTPGTQYTIIVQASSSTGSSTTATVTVTAN
ncbi:archaellin/type IV pilin N-terminal domain-containing protein [Conexivisphaera calida]|nr:archaellin/type IV pilin N-terminal domain-containing protein [Conexivisphaera calida]